MDPKALRHRAWLVAAGASLLVGVLVGTMLPRPNILPWSEGVADGGMPHAALPSLAPIVKAVRSAVVGVRAYRRSVASADADTEGHEAVMHGSGFVIHADGLVVTNHHLIAGASHFLVDVPGFPALVAEVRGMDQATDLAVLRLNDPPAGLTVLALGDSAVVEQGDWVVALGNPFEFHQSVTIGIVSYVGRHLPEEGLMVTNEYLQFSAPVNPGSSGGPLLNLQGQVVGVTTRMHASAQGISFAVPSKVLKWVLTSMDRNGGIVARGFLGIRFQPLPRTGAVQGTQGALVMEVQENRPAHRAGLQQGDVILEFAGRPVASAYDLHDWITQTLPGSKVEIVVLRNGARMPACVVELGGLPTATQSAGSGVELQPRYG